MLISKAENDKAILEIHSDENPESPRECDHFGEMICFHRNYNLGDKHNYRSEDFSGWDELKKQIINDHDPVSMLPLYLMDHSGLTIRTDPSMFRACDSHGFDWGQVGWIYASCDSVRKKYGIKRVTKSVRKKVIAALEAEVSVYDQYLQGEVYGYVLHDKITGEEDSCWGFFCDPKASGMAEYLGEHAVLLDDLVAV